MTGGYMGKILFVDLSTGEIKEEALRLFEEKLKSTHIPFGLSILCVVAQKLWIHKLSALLYELD